MSVKQRVFFVFPIDKNEKTQDYQTHYTQPKSINQTRNQKKKKLFGTILKKKGDIETREEKNRTILTGNSYVMSSNKNLMTF